MLKLDKLVKTYKTGDQALKAVDIEIPQGQVLALIGPSGAGKSTLIRCINRLVEPTSGQVYLNDVELTCLSTSALRRERRRMGMIFQEYALIERLTVMENVLSGRLGYVGFWRSFLRKFPQSDIDEAYRLLDRVGLADMADKRADELSGGQRQRVGICRALIQNPALLLVDEPTASLDPKTSRQIMRLICELCQERNLAAIINIHDVALAQMFVQRVVGLRFGAVKFDGPPENLTSEVLTMIYGEEDWEATIEKVEDDDEVDLLSNGFKLRENATTTNHAATYIYLAFAESPRAAWRANFRDLNAAVTRMATLALGGRIAVRGGSPEQNLTVMDGIELHQPFRLTIPIEDLAMVGLGSVLNPDTLDRVELVPGAFDVRHGDRLSSLLVVTNLGAQPVALPEGEVLVTSGPLTDDGRVPRDTTAWVRLPVR